MTRLLAIDPGNTESGFVIVGDSSLRAQYFDKVPNDQLLKIIETEHFDQLAIEMVASYGMAVGRDVFETCVWIGRFEQQAIHHAGVEARLVYRRDIKLHHCGSSKAKDSNITQALIDRFAHNEPNRGKGTKAARGWFYGFAGDIWQAYALAVYAAETPQEVPF